MALSKRLLPGWSGVTAGPLSPPLRRAARLSRRRWPFCFSGPWHFQQCSASAGRMRFSKNSTPAVSCDRADAVQANTSKLQGQEQKETRMIFDLEAVSKRGRDLWNSKGRVPVLKQLLL